MKSLRNLFFVLALIAMPAFSQELTSDITGVVTNSAGAPVSGATVSVTYTPTNKSITTYIYRFFWDLRLNYRKKKKKNYRRITAG